MPKQGELELNLAPLCFGMTRSPSVGENVGGREIFLPSLSALSSMFSVFSVFFWRKRVGSVQQSKGQSAPLRLLGCLGGFSTSTLPFSHTKYCSHFVLAEMAGAQAFPIFSLSHVRFAERQVCNRDMREENLFCVDLFVSAVRTHFKATRGVSLALIHASQSTKHEDLSTLFDHQAHAPRSFHRTNGALCGWSSWRFGALGLTERSPPFIRPSRTEE